MFTNNTIMAMLFKSQTMLVLLCCSVVVLTFALERWIYFARTRYSAREFKAAMRKYLTRNQLGDFGRYCAQSSGSLGRIMGVAVENLSAGREQVDLLLDTEIEKEQLKLEKHLTILGTLANVGPLLGLFGTVVGIIRAFHDIAITGSGGSSVIAMGVSEALVATATGIAIAVIATVFYNTFTRTIRVRTTDAEDARNDFWKYVNGRPVE